MGSSTSTPRVNLRQDVCDKPNKHYLVRVNKGDSSSLVCPLCERKKEEEARLQRNQVRAGMVRKNHREQE